MPFGKKTTPLPLTFLGSNIASFTLGHCLDKTVLAADGTKLLPVRKEPSTIPESNSSSVLFSGAASGASEHEGQIRITEYDGPCNKYLDEESL